MRLNDTTAGILNPWIEVKQYEMMWTRKKGRRTPRLGRCEGRGGGKALIREGCNVSQRKQEQQAGLGFEEKGRYVTDRVSPT